MAFIFALAKPSCLQPMKQSQNISCSANETGLRLFSIEAANSKKDQACHFSALVSVFSLETRKCTLLTQCRLNIKISECSPVPHHCFLLSPSEIPERHYCPSGSDLFYFHMASSIFLHVLILLADRLGPTPHSHVLCFSTSLQHYHVHF